MGLVVLCAVPRAFDSEALAADLVSRQLAACVQIGPEITSVYRWQGAIETGAERLLIIKTSPERYRDLEAAIRRRHPYEVPEIVALQISAGYPPYIAWLAAATSAPNPSLDESARS
jgi:periplasmic divalent cation tolerance protein